MSIHNVTYSDTPPILAANITCQSVRANNNVNMVWIGAEGGGPALSEATTCNLLESEL
jgi:hypothetical protein